MAAVRPPGVPLDLAFKGDRDYLHGTDIFQALVDVLGAHKEIELRLQRIVRHPLIAVDLDTTPLERSATSVFASFVDEAGRKRAFALMEDAGLSVSKRYSYDEAAAIACANFAPGSASLELSAHFTFIEQTVALQKALLSRDLEIPAQSGRWLFSQLSLSRLPKPNERKLHIAIRANLGSRLVKSDILIDRATPLGQIAFSLGPKN